MKEEMPEKDRIKRKLLLLVLAIILFIAALVFQQCTRVKERKQYEQYLEQQSEKEKSEEREREQVLDQMEETQEENQISGQEQTPEEDRIPISNLDEYAAAIMGDNAVWLEQSLAAFMGDDQTDSASALILSVMTPENDTESVCFFVRAGEKPGTLVTLTYHMREQVVTSAACSYTEEDIANEVWSDDGPAQRDVDPEADSEFLKNQEGTDESRGEN